MSETFDVCFRHLFQAIALTDAGCGESKGCVRIPSDCKQPNCKLLATYRTQGEEVTFELFGRDVDWVAIGFNNVQLMVCILFYYILYFT